MVEQPDTSSPSARPGTMRSRRERFAAALTIPVRADGMDASGAQGTFDFTSLHTLAFLTSLDSAALLILLDALALPTSLSENLISLLARQKAREPRNAMFK